MAGKKEDYSNASYVVGIASIVLAFFTPLAGLIFGIVGIVLGRRQNTTLSRKGRIFSVIGIILSLVVWIVATIVSNNIAGASGGAFPVR